MQIRIGLTTGKDEIILSLGTADCILKWSDTVEPNVINRAMVSALDQNTHLSTGFRCRVITGSLMRLY